MTSISTCEDYHCEFTGDGDHSHVGVRPYLRRVVGPDKKLVDGATGEILEPESLQGEK